MAVFPFPRATCCPTNTSSWGRLLAPQNCSRKLRCRSLPAWEPHGLCSPWDSLPVDCQLHRQPGVPVPTHTDQAPLPGQPCRTLVKAAHTHRPLRGGQMRRKGCTLHSPSPRVSASPFSLPNWAILHCPSSLVLGEPALIKALGLGGATDSCHGPLDSPYHQRTHPEPLMALSLGPRVTGQVTEREEGGPQANGRKQLFSSLGKSWVLPKRGISGEKKSMIHTWKPPGAAIPARPAPFHPTSTPSSQLSLLSSPLPCCHWLVPLGGRNFI